MSLYDTKSSDGLVGWLVFMAYQSSTRASSFHKHLIKCENNDDNFSIKIEVKVCDDGNLRIKEALWIAKLHP